MENNTIKNSKNNGQNSIIRRFFLVISILWGLLVLVFFNLSHSFPYQTLLGQAEFILTSIKFNPELLSYYLEIIIAFCGVGFLVLFSFLAGRLVLIRIKVEFDNVLEIFILSTGSGMVIVNFIIFISGVLGFIDILTFLVLFAILFVGLLYFNIKGKDQFVISERRLKNDRLKLFDWIIIILISVLGFIYITGTLSPEVFYDSLVYHLGAANQYVQHGRLIYFQNEIHANMPIAMSQFYTFLLLFGNEISAKLFHMFTGVLVLFAIISFSKRFFNKRVGLMAGLAFLSIPLIARNSWSAAADMGLTCFTFLYFYAFFIWLKKRPVSRHILILSGILAGFTMTIKYTAVFGLVSLIMVMIIFFLQNKKRNLIKNLFVFSGTAFIILLPWLIKNWIMTGDPLFPYLAAYMGGDQGYLEFIKVTREYFSGIIDFIFHPWTLTMTGKTGNSFIGPLFLMFLPIILFIKSHHRRIKYFKFFALCFWVLCILSTRMLRFYSPAFPIISILIAAGIIYQVPHRTFRRSLYLVFLTGVMINMFWTFNFAYQLQGWRVLNGDLSKKKYLLQDHSGYHNLYYHGADFINQKTDPDSKILLIGEARSYYIERKVFVNSVFDENPVVAWTRESETVEDLTRKFREHGITHVMFNMKELMRFQKQYNIFRWSQEERALFNRFSELVFEKVYEHDHIIIYHVKYESVSV